MMYLNFLLFGSGKDKWQRLADEKAEAKTQAAYTAIDMKDNYLKFAELKNSMKLLQLKMDDMKGTNQTLLAETDHMISEVKKLARKQDELQKAITATRIKRVRDLTAIQVARDQSMRKLEDWYRNRLWKPNAGSVRVSGS